MANTNLTRLKNAEAAALSGLNFVCGGPAHIEFLDMLQRAINASGSDDDLNQRVQDMAELLFTERMVHGLV